MCIPPGPANAGSGLATELHQNTVDGSSPHTLRGAPEYTLNARNGILPPQIPTSAS